MKKRIETSFNEHHTNTTEKQRIEKSFSLSHCWSVTTSNSLYFLLMSILFYIRTNIEGGIAQNVTLCGTRGLLIMHIHRFFLLWFTFLCIFLRILFRNSILIVWMVTFHLFLFQVRGTSRVSYGRFLLPLYEGIQLLVVNNFMWKYLRKYLSHVVDRERDKFHCIFNRKLCRWISEKCPWLWDFPEEIFMHTFECVHAEESQRIKRHDVTPHLSPCQAKLVRPKIESSTK